MTRFVVLDFETASEADLTRVGAWAYAQHPSTRVLCTGYQVIDDGVLRPIVVLDEAETAGAAVELRRLAGEPETIFVAHNAAFEQAIWKAIMIPRHRYPHIPVLRWADTAAVAARYGLPLGLERLCSAIALPVQKDMQGAALMRRLCKPDKDGSWHHHNPTDLARLRAYNRTDVEAQTALWLKLPAHGKRERRVWALDQVVNQRGVRIDVGYVRACIDLLEKARLPLERKFLELTGARSGQVARVLEWAIREGAELTNLRTETIDDLLEDAAAADADDPLIPPHVAEALELRRSLASSSVKKLSRMLTCLSPDGRIRYTMQYAGARTLRASGRLIQVQNFPRGEYGAHPGVTQEMLQAAVRTGRVEAVQELWGMNVFSAVAATLRGCIIAGPGRTLVAGDFLGIEARLIMALSGQRNVLERMHAGEDIYADMASTVYERPIDKKKDPAERQLGKNAVLGAQYGLGANGFRTKFAKDHPLSMCARTIDAYRKKFAPQVPKLWYGLHDAALIAVRSRGAKAGAFRGVEFRLRGGFLEMRPPVDEAIYYYAPALSTDRFDNEAIEFTNFEDGRAVRKTAWHGLLTNNFIQFVARQLMVAAMFKAEAAGLPVIFTVHDELVCEPPDDGRDHTQTLEHLMVEVASEPPFKDLDLLIGAEAWQGQEYRK